MWENRLCLWILVHFGNQKPVGYMCGHDDFTGVSTEMPILGKVDVVEQPEKGKKRFIVAHKIKMSRDKIRTFIKEMEAAGWYFFHEGVDMKDHIDLLKIVAESPEITIE